MSQLSTLLTPKVLVAGGALLATAASYYIYNRVTAKPKTKYWSTGSGCCPPTSEPALATSYTPQGQWITVDGLGIYVTGSVSKKAIICFHDALGPLSGRTIEICDQFAAKGSLVVMPVFFHGLSPDVDINFWTMFFFLPKLGRTVSKFPWSKVEKDLNLVVYPYLEKRGVTRIGCIGYCWGNWAVLHASASDKISVGVSFHPSVMRVADRFGEKASDIFSNVKSPQATLTAMDDPDALKKGGELDQILSTKSFGRDCVFEHFPQMHHGWVNRGRLDDPIVLRDVKKALEIASKFIERHIG